MLKQLALFERALGAAAAAFGRLCVETDGANLDVENVDAAAFGRLCVETAVSSSPTRFTLAAAFGRLCVETRAHSNLRLAHRLQPPSGGCVLKHRFLTEYLQVPSAAAFGRLCVETVLSLLNEYGRICSRLRAAVC